MFRFACSVKLWGGRGSADKCHWRVWGALAVFPPHWVCPHSWHMCFPHLHCLGSRLLYGAWALSCVWFQFWGPPQKRRLGWACVLCLPSPSSSGSQESPEGRVCPSLTGAVSLGAVCLLPSMVPASVSLRVSRVCAPCSRALVSAATLLADVNHPESQEVFG